MLELGMDLPPGALCDAPTAALAEDLAGLGATWWHGAEALFATDSKSGAIKEWWPLIGTTAAIPTTPNTGNGLIGAAGDLIGLQCREAVHCGLFAEDVAADASTATIALRYLPPHGGAARTLVTFNTGGKGRKAKTDNYLFLSEADDTLLVKDNAGLVELALPAPATDAPRMVVVSHARSHLAAVILDGAAAEATARAPILTGPGSLFIGCRNQRSGLTKTLGSALICDVWLLPGRAILGADGPENRAALRALKRFHLWTAED